MRNFKIRGGGILRPGFFVSISSVCFLACAVSPDTARANPAPRKKQAVTVAARKTETHSVKETAPRLLDALTFGNANSEQKHGLTAKDSDTIAGGLGLSARRLLPVKPASFEGGTLAFTMKVDPEKPNYVTVRLWGSDVSQNRLVLFCEGKQIGYHHLGDVDILDFGTDSDAPGYNGRFFYTTSPLPVGLTQGRSELHFEIRCLGRIWGYGGSFEDYQRNMETPTRGIYRFYTHTDGYFQPPADDKQGTAPSNPPVRKSPGPEVLDRLKERVNGEIKNILNHNGPINQMQMQFLAKAYHVKWCAAYENPQVVAQVVKGLDALYLAYGENPKLAQAEPSTYNPDWFGLGPAGDAVRLLKIPLQSELDAMLGANGPFISRRAAWSEMLQASRDWHRRHRVQYTNQTMIVDMYIYAANLGVAAIDPKHALPETQTRHYLYQAVGIDPWLGSDTDNGPDKPLGENYYQMTRAGLTRELGFVGYYGEVLDWIAQIYDVTRDPGQAGDEKIKGQLTKLTHARAVFRYPALDGDGGRAMRAETIVGWRDSHYPGDVTYSERPSWDGSALYAAAMTLDPEAIGAVQQMFADNQFFASVENSLKDNMGLRVVAGMLGVPDQYEVLRAHPAGSRRLPMSAEQPDFVWADPEDGVVAIKRGAEILYVSLYWRARFAINNLARVHYITPRFDRIAVTRQESQFEPSGMFYTLPDWIDFGFGGGGHHYPGDRHQAFAGEQQPIPKIPDGVKFRPGDENSYAGKADFYTFRYGNYLIGMNCAREKSYDLTLPAGIAKARNLTTGKNMALKKSLPVAPLSTVVLYLGRD